MPWTDHENGGFQVHKQTGLWWRFEDQHRVCFWIKWKLVYPMETWGFEPATLTSHFSQHSSQPSQCLGCLYSGSCWRILTHCMRPGQYLTRYIPARRKLVIACGCGFMTQGSILGYQNFISFNCCLLFVYAGLRLNNAWDNGTLRLFRQPESPLSSQSLVSGFKCKLRDSNSRPTYSRPGESNHEAIHHPPDSIVKENVVH